MPRHFLVFAVVAVPAFAAVLNAQERVEATNFDVKEHYTKYEYRVPMRDGVHLFTAVYVDRKSTRLNSSH